jgi:hypothetical protein
MSNTITPTHSIHPRAPGAAARRDVGQPWMDHGVAAERAQRAEHAYAAELVHAEYQARGREQALGGGR